MKEKRMQIETGELFSILSNTINGGNFDDLNDAVYRIYDVANYRKQEWISVEDDTPKNSLARVQVFLRNADITDGIGFPKIDTDRYIDGKWVRWGKYVTHWMPLPEPPKMKGN